MIWLYIILGIVGLILLLFIIFLLIVLREHNKAFNKRFINPISNTYSKEYFNLDYKKIEINYKNKYIRGELYSYQGYDNDKLIIFCHGMNSSKESYIQEMAYLAKNGFLVLGFDNFGTQDSDGILGGLSNNLKALDLVIKYVKNDSELKNKDIYVIGHSWGGAAALNIIKFHKDIKKIVALAPVVSFYKLLKEMEPKRSAIVSLMILLIEKLKYGKYADLNTIKALNNYQGEIMVVQSKDDYQVRFESSLGLLKNKLKRNANYLEVDNKGHNPDYTENAVKLVKEFVSNISKYNGKELEEYMANQDYFSMGELDNDVMDKLVAFLK